MRLITTNINFNHSSLSYKINKNRFSVIFRILSLFFVGFFELLRKVTKVSENDLLKAPTTLDLLPETILYVKDPTKFSPRHCVNTHSKNTSNVKPIHSLFYSESKMRRGGVGGYRYT